MTIGETTENNSQATQKTINRMAISTYLSSKLTINVKIQGDRRW